MNTLRLIGFTLAIISATTDALKGNWSGLMGWGCTALWILIDWFDAKD